MGASIKEYQQKNLTLSQVFGILSAPSYPFWLANYYSRPSPFCHLDSFFFGFSQNEKNASEKV
jgi:hypothetical protein